MSGASMVLRCLGGTTPLQRGMHRVLRAGQRTRPLQRAMGEYLVRSTQDRFDAQEDPDGTPWKPVQPARWAVKRIKKILTESGHLRDRITYQAAGSTIEWGTNVAYAGIHQDGGTTSAHVIRARKGRALNIPGIGPRKSVNHPGSQIPRRAFLGISADDGRELLAIVHDYYQAAVRG